MKQSLEIVILATVCMTCVRADRKPGLADGPVLLASGKNYTVHVFAGAVQGMGRLSRVVGPGIVVFHTETSTGKARWMIRTGTFAIPTVRISYSTSRLLGMLQSDTHLAAITYYSGRIFDGPPRVLPPDKGGYRLSVFEKASGKQLFGVELDLSSARPKQVPKETAKLGIIEKTDDGFSVLGTSFLILDDGSMKRKGSKQKNAPDKK